MKVAFLMSALLLAVVNVAQAKENKTTSAELVSQVLVAVEGIKGLDSNCSVEVLASTKNEEFAAITVMDMNTSKSVTLKLKSSEGTIVLTRSGTSAYSTETFKTKSAELSLTTYEDISDLSIDLRVNNESLSCKFSE